MPEHTGLPVSGYKPQSEAKVALVNSFKADEERLLRKLDGLFSEMAAMEPEPTKSQMPYDPRWIAIARTHFEQGFMALNRSVFQPGRVALPEDAEGQ